MTLSNDNSVSWRLNDLLTADRKAKEFAAVGWNEGEHVSETEAGFQEFSPRVINIEDAHSEESVDKLEEEVVLEDHEPLDEGAEELAEVNSLEQEDTQEHAQEQEEAAAVYAEEALQEAKLEAHDIGYEKGRAEAQADYQKSKDNLDSLIASLRTAQSDMTEFYRPLKKLALHLAEQLVRGELSISSAAIERIAKAALDDVERQGEGPILIYLHPADRDQFSEEMYDEFSTIELRSDRTLSQGSVKISIDDSAIEDLIEQRLDKLAEQVLGISMPSRAKEERAPFVNQVEEKVVHSTSEEIHEGPHADSNYESDNVDDANDIAVDEPTDIIEVDPDV